MIVESQFVQSHKIKTVCQQFIEEEKGTVLQGAQYCKDFMALVCRIKKEYVLNGPFYLWS